MNKCSLQNFAEDWIQTEDFWNRKWPLCQMTTTKISCNIFLLETEKSNLKFVEISEKYLKVVSPR